MTLNLEPMGFIKMKLLHFTINNQKNWPNLKIHRFSLFRFYNKTKIDNVPFLWKWLNLELKMSCLNMLGRKKVNMVNLTRICPKDMESSKIQCSTHELKFFLLSNLSKGLHCLSSYSGVQSKEYKVSSPQSGHCLFFTKVDHLNFFAFKFY